MRGWQPVDAEVKSHLPFSPAVEANGFIFVSGQASVDETGKIIPGTFEEEMRRSFDNVRRVLEHAGLTLEDVIRVTSYIRDPVNGPTYNELYREFFSSGAYNVVELPVRGAAVRGRCDCGPTAELTPDGDLMDQAVAWISARM